MTELDQVWSQMLAEAGVDAETKGLSHIADYFRLRATNDAIRAKGVMWLLGAVIEAASEAQRHAPSIKIERIDPHSFSHGSSTMVGSLISVHYGVRCLTVEAGWARIPSHGIMRKGALAIANISHFGMPKAGTVISLVRGDAFPQWVDSRGEIVDSTEINRHVDVLLDRQ